MANKRKTNGSLGLYRSYNFVDKDPIIDRTRGFVKASGLSYAEIHKLSGVTASTLHNWFEGDTRRPQYATVMAVIRSLGYRVTYTKGKV